MQIAMHTQTVTGRKMVNKTCVVLCALHFSSFWSHYLQTGYLHTNVNIDTISRSSMHCISFRFAHSVAVCRCRRPRSKTKNFLILHIAPQPSNSCDPEYSARHKVHKIIRCAIVAWLQCAFGTSASNLIYTTASCVCVGRYLLGRCSLVHFAVNWIGPILGGI